MPITIEKAIEKLEEQKRGKEVTGATGYAKSLQLGIEALKRVKENRETIPAKHTWLLPGETEK
jgi:hypothetical protein